MNGGWRSWFEEDEHLLQQLLLRAEVFVSDRVARNPVDEVARKLRERISEVGAETTKEQIALILYQFDRYRYDVICEEPWQTWQIECQLEAEKVALERYAGQCQKDHHFLVSLALSLIVSR
jgi:hypothetical protein